jgi:hypothetical protein
MLAPSLPSPETTASAPLARLVREILAARRDLRHGPWLAALRELGRRDPALTASDVHDVVRSSYGAEGIARATAIATRWCHVAPRPEAERIWIGAMVRRRTLPCSRLPAATVVGALSVYPHARLWLRLAEEHPTAAPPLFSSLHVAIARDPAPYAQTLDEALASAFDPDPTLGTWLALVRAHEEWCEPCGCDDCRPNTRTRREDREGAALSGLPRFRRGRPGARARGGAR